MPQPRGTRVGWDASSRLDARRGSTALRRRFEPEIGRSNARELRLLERIAGLDSEAPGGLGAALAATGQKLEYRGRLSSPLLARALRAALEAAKAARPTSPPPEEPETAPRPGSRQAQPEAAPPPKVVVEEAADDETVELLFRKVAKAKGGKNNVQLEDFIGLVRRAGIALSLDPLKAALERPGPRGTKAPRRASRRPRRRPLCAPGQAGAPLLG